MKFADKYAMQIISVFWYFDHRTVAWYGCGIYDWHNDSETFVYKMEKYIIKIRNNK